MHFCAHEFMSDGWWVCYPGHRCRTICRYALLVWGDILSSSISRGERVMWQCLLDQEMERIMGVFKDRLSVGPAGEIGGGFHDPDFSIRYPTLYIFLSASVDDDGKKRQTSTLMWFIEDGQCKGCMRERNVGLTLWVSSSSILGVLEALEEALNTNPVPWRRTDASGVSRRVKA